MLKDLGKKLKETGQNAVNQTKKVAEIANLNAKINKSHGDISKEIAALGKKFYVNAKGKVPKGYEAEFSAIEEIKKNIRDMKEKIAELKEEKVVKDEVPDIPEEEPAVEIKEPVKPKPAPKTKAEPKNVIPSYTVTQRVCKACNKPLVEGENVCAHCGTVNVDK